MGFIVHRRAARARARFVSSVLAVWLAGSGSLALGQRATLDAATVAGTVTSLGGARLPHASITLTARTSGGIRRWLPRGTAAPTCRSRSRARGSRWR